MASKLSPLFAGAAARREALWKRASAFSSPAASAPRPPQLPLLPTDAAALALAHGPTAPALVCSLTGRVTTFAGLAETARATAEALRSRVADFDDEKSKNVDPQTGARASGPRVAVLGRPSPGFAAALWGVWAAGGCAVPLHHALPERATAASLADVGASAILFSGPSCSSDDGGEGEKEEGNASFEARARSLAALAAETRDANGGLLPGPPACLPWAALLRGAGGGGREGTALPRVSSSRPASANVFDDDPSSGALVIFTSGTTGRPKPALHSHRSLAAQAQSLRAAWDLSSGDLVLNCLPWHHIHGLSNALLAPLAAGAAVEVAPGFSPATAWEALCRGRRRKGGGGGGTELSPSPTSTTFAGRPVSVFMGVPTMYSHLLSALETEREGSSDGGEEQDKGRHSRKKKKLPSFEEAARAAAALRLSVCGSAACPVPLARRWDELVERGRKAKRKAEEEEGATPSSSPSSSTISSTSSPASSSSSSSLLERYGMTEAGMILGQSLEGPRARGVVGRPMPGVEVKLLQRRTEAEEDGDNEKEEVDSLDRGLRSSLPPLPAATGELLVRWPGMFSAYWGRGRETREAFLLEDVGDKEGGKWFATGDVALRDSASSSENGQNRNDYRLLGRASVDILKVGGEKVSALEVEDALLSLEGVSEAAVVDVDGGDRGDAVGAVLVLASTAATGAFSLPPLSLEQLRDSLSKVLPKAALPSRVAFVEALPRNAMGKVDKRRAREEAFGKSSGGGGGGGGGK